jgi:hypothetical protein
MTATRRLAAIFAADVAGYSRLMGADEERTHERLKAHRHNANYDHADRGTLSRLGSTRRCAAADRWSRADANGRWGWGCRRWRRCWGYQY